MKKFKVGDRVKIVKKSNRYKWLPSMKNTIGKTGTIVHIFKTIKNDLLVADVQIDDRTMWAYYINCLEPAIPYKKIIQRIINESI